MATTLPDPRLADLLGALDQAFDGDAWHGAHLREAVASVDAAGAAWRPAPGRNTIWELTLHCAYWKVEVVRRLDGDLPPVTPEVAVPVGTPFTDLADWQPGPSHGAADDDAWQRDRARLAASHRALRQTVARLDPARLDRPSRSEGPFSVAAMIQGIVLHDTYHGGQIGLLARLYAQR